MQQHHIGDNQTIEFDDIDSQVRAIEKAALSDNVIPWRVGDNVENRRITFQQGKKFEAIYKTYNSGVLDGRGKKSLKSFKGNYSFIELPQVSLLDFLPDTVANCLEGLMPVKKKSRLANASASANEVEEVHTFSGWKYKPERNLTFSLDVPDSHFYADRFMNLRYGRTAFRLVEPEVVSAHTPVIVCLHGLLDFSYIWSDIAELLAKSEEGPKARVLLFDFHGHGRSEWSGVPNSLDVLVSQTKELLEGKLMHTPNV